MNHGDASLHPWLGRKDLYEIFYLNILLKYFILSSHLGDG